MDEAMAHYREALRLRPDYAKAQSNLGLLLLQRGRLDEAVAYFEAALRAAPGLTEARGNLGLALERLGGVVVHGIETTPARVLAGGGSLCRR